jgi:NAD(P)-dependent dehydrogenase (short-subunit alcohol dehydrogenase family)
MSRNIVITGANRGIGLALTQTYLNQGDHVYAVCRNSSNELAATDAKVIDSVDVSKPKDIQGLSTKMSGVEIDILINNAGILHSQSLQSLDFDLVEKQFNINAIAPLRVVDALLNNLKAGSKIAMITSRMGSIEDNTSGSSYGYRMSKCALNIAGKSLSIDLKPQQISVALLHPGYVQTEMVNFGGDISSQVSAERLIQRIEDLNIENTGSFWHSNGELLPW